jgi:hypothetical protein
LPVGLLVLVRFALLRIRAHAQAHARRGGWDRGRRRRRRDDGGRLGALFAGLAQGTGTAIVCATHDPVLIEHAGSVVALGTVAA